MAFDFLFHLRLFWLQSIQNHAKVRFQAFCPPPSEVAVQFDWKLSRHPVLGDVVDLDLLLCTGFHSDFSVCPIFTQKSMNDWTFEQSNEHSFCR